MIRAKLMAVTELQQLLVLQDLDTRAEQLRYRRSHLAQRSTLAATDGALGAIAAEAATCERERAALDKRQAEIDASVETMRAKEQSLGAQLAKSIVPKEAETLQAELKGLHQRRDAAEDDELAIMEAVEPIEARLTVLAAQKVPLLAQRDIDAAALAAAEAAVDAELATAAAQRALTAAPLPASLMARYDKMRGHLGGVAVARLDHGTCMGCNIQLSSTEREALLAAPPDALAECEQCGRLLVR